MLINSSRYELSHFVRPCHKKKQCEKGYFSYVYQKQYVLLEDQCEKNPHTLIPFFLKFIIIQCVSMYFFFNNEVIYLSDHNLKRGFMLKLLQIL